MNEIKGDTIRNAVASKVSSFYSCDVYKESVNQDYPTPCFFIWQKKIECTKKMANQLSIRNDIEVHYVPSITSKSPYEDSFDVGIHLMALLSMIDSPLGTMQSLDSRGFPSLNWEKKPILNSSGEPITDSEGNSVLIDRMIPFSGDGMSFEIIQDSLVFSANYNVSCINDDSITTRMLFLASQTTVK